MSRFLRQQLKMRDLRVIDAVSRHGSVLSASAELLVSQPAVSKSLRRAEVVFGTLLFERFAHGVRPTSSGFAVVASAAKILREVELLETQLSMIDPPVVARCAQQPVLAVRRMSVHRVGAISIQPRAESPLHAA